MVKAKKNTINREQKEQRIRNTIEGIQSGLYKSARSAARQLDVPHSTLKHRIARRKTPINSHEEEQLLSPTEEIELVRWITQLTIGGYPPHHLTFRAMAEALRQRHINQINEDAIELVWYPPISKE